MKDKSYYEEDIKDAIQELWNSTYFNDDKNIEKEGNIWVHLKDSDFFLLEENIELFEYVKPDVKDFIKGFLTELNNYRGQTTHKVASVFKNLAHDSKKSDEQDVETIQNHARALINLLGANIGTPHGNKAKTVLYDIANNPKKYMMPKIKVNKMKKDVLRQYLLQDTDIPRNLIDKLVSAI